MRCRLLDAEMDLPYQTDQKYYNIILDSIEEGVFTVDLDWSITSFNKAAERITGVLKEEAVGRLCSEVFNSNVCDTMDCAIRKTMHTDTPIINMPVYILRSDDKRIPISVNASVLKDRNGHVIGGVETFRDLSAITQLRKSLRKHYSFENMVSKNQKMLDIFSTLLLIADSDCTVLIEGATGTGKELLAKAIHKSSPKKNGPFVPVNCGALPDTLIESELFG